ncbi:type II toxin-antitoxin system RelE/ParE family toxin [Delftia acidovorans]|jgi:putative addiction module killer protein|uniref:type II toxin-antitoxin system RelE/ParE family toxin n=1 Tax=Delftia acidovorans TaxID=80866 RepID=UPI00284CDC91|nr:type II toxin-antitoxin system RelE/ParE family toxin [Delftia acidovorans]
MSSYRIEHYLAFADRRDVYLEWLGKLRDSRAKSAVIRRVARIELGNFGDHRFCRDGVWELRIDVGPGYRVFYALSGQRVVLLLCAGDKRSQDADIARAVTHWQDWQRRSDDEKQTP